MTKKNTYVLLGDEYIENNTYMTKELYRGNRLMCIKEFDENSKHGIYRCLSIVNTKKLSQYYKEHPSTYDW